MWRPRSAAVGIGFGLTVLLTAPGNGVAQSRSPLGPAGASVRPPRLTGTTPSTSAPVGGRFGRRFDVPYQYLPWYPAGSSDYAYPDDSTGAYSTEAEPVREVYPVYDSVPAVGRLQVSLEPIGSRTMVRC